LLAAVSCLLLCWTAVPTTHGQELSTELVVTAEEYSPVALSSLFYGNFVESGIDRQVEGMWAEMLFNRSFEEFPPRGPSWQQVIGQKSRAELNEQPWYHSGHEDNPWYQVPDDDVSWETTSNGGFYHGRHGGMLDNGAEDRWGGIAQDGLYLRKEESYTFRGFLRARRHKARGFPEGFTTGAEVRVYPEGDFAKPLGVWPINGVGEKWTEFTVRLENAGINGRVTFSFWIPPEVEFNVDAFSLMPNSNTHGWREDVVDMTQRVNPQIIRWPGGCFASFYNWRDGIGPRSSRNPRPDVFWGGLVNNDAGTPEFVQFCRLVNAEPFICVNVMTSTPEEAAEWVAYCNAPATDRTGALRKRDGFEAPFGVKYWELDNETYRKYDPLTYAEVCVEFGKAMKAIDPDIKLAMCAYHTFEPVMAEMLEIAGKHIDLVALRFRTAEQGVRALKLIHDYNAEHETNIQLVNTEWSASPRGPSRQVEWNYGLWVAELLLMYQRLGGDFLWGNFNNLTNTRHSNCFETPKEGIYMSPAGLVLELLSHSPAARPLKLKGHAPDPKSPLHIQAAWDRDRNQLVLIVVNRQAEAWSGQFDLSDLALEPSHADIAVLRAESGRTYNTLTEPNNIRREDRSEVLSASRKHALSAPPYSIVHVVLK
jgi:alpha-L-arabinofuranosidase